MNIQEMAEYKRISVMPSERGRKPSEGSKAKSRISRVMDWIRAKFREMKKRIEKFFENRDDGNQAAEKESEFKKKLLKVGEDAYEVGEGISKTAAFGLAGILYFCGTVFIAIGVISVVVNILVAAVTMHSIGTTWLGIGLWIFGLLLQLPMNRLDAVGRARLAEEERKFKEKAEAMNKENTRLKDENKRLKGGK